MNLTPNAAAAHWSAAYVGLPWRAGAVGPDAFDCWGLVRHVQETHYGRKLGHLEIASEGNQWSAVREIVQRSGWARSPEPREGDVMLMLDALGCPHVGIAILTPRPKLLHSLQGRGVQLHRMDWLGALGLGHLQCWSHA